MTTLQDASAIFTRRMWMKMRDIRFDGEPQLYPRLENGEFLWVWSECLRDSRAVLEVDGIVSRFYTPVELEDGHTFIDNSLATNVIVGWRYDGHEDCAPDGDDYCNCHPFEYKPLSYQFGEEMCETCWLQRHRVITQKMCGVADHAAALQEAMSG